MTAFNAWPQALPFQSRPGDEPRLLSLLALARLPILRTREKILLAEVLESGIALRELSLRDVEEIAGRSLPQRSWDPQSLLATAEGDALLLDRLGAVFFSILDPGFPPALREIAQPPFGLFLRGQALTVERPAISIVGTRYPTGAGLESALAFARDFACLGFPVISGLARGIDAAAHRGALAGGGPTCAVLPCGVDAFYPVGNSGLAGAILSSGGLLVSEYPPGTEIRKSRFPERNRIISGLSRGLLVVEAPSDSGALITADFALDQGRDVFVAASRLGGPRSAGIDRLALEGSRPVASAQDILVEWGIEAPAELLDPRAEDYYLAPVVEGQAESAAWGRNLAAALRAELALASRESPSSGGYSCGRTW